MSKAFDFNAAMPLCDVKAEIVLVESTTDVAGSQVEIEKLKWQLQAANDLLATSKEIAKARVGRKKSGEKKAAKKRKQIEA